MTDSYLKPRAHLNGVQLPPDFALPSMAQVREDVTRLISLKREGPGRVYFLNSATVPEKENNQGSSEPFMYSLMLENLFKWSYFVNVKDVPDDLIGDCIWTLKMIIRVWEEGSEGQLLTTGYLLRGQKYENAKYFALLNARRKVVHHLMISRPKEAIPYMELLIEEEARLTKQLPWITNPVIFAWYGEALTRACVDDEKAKKVLERVLSPPVVLQVAMMVTSKLFLSRTLRRLREDASAVKHETWVINWFRKNPHLMPDSGLRRLFKCDGETTDPVLDGLGGQQWLDEREHSTKTDHNLSKQCAHCLARSVQKKLRQCTGCRHTYYCSPECQKKGWKSHRPSCEDMAKTLKKIEQLKLTNVAGAQKLLDWKEWRVEPTSAWALMHALGLHRDMKRGRTHIVVKQVVYAPTASTELKFKFRVVACGVFKISDILPEIEAMMGLHKGEGTEYIEGLFQGPERIDPDEKRMPIIDLSFGDGVETWLGASSTTEHILRLQPYNPQWRQTMNLGEAPQVLRFSRQGLEDQEHIF